MLETQIDKIIEKIASLQSKGNTYFSEGIFPAYRANKYWFYTRADNNIFYTATIVFTLNQIKENLSEKSQKLVENITEKAIKNYPKFQNKDGLKTYNFYETNPSKHFPNGFIFKHLRHFQLPDDIDDTALIYLTKGHSEGEKKWLKNKLNLHANLVNFQVKNTFERYKNLKVYSTWFGKNMPIEFDACALCNLMYFIFKNDLPLNEHDHDTLKFLASVILNEEYISDPFKVAHNYATTPLIIYHFARLMNDFEISELEICREKLVEKTLQLLNNEEVMMNKVILETAFFRLTSPPAPLHRRGELLTFSLPLWGGRAGFKGEFRFFIAGLLSSYENPFLHYFANKKFTQIEWQCEAHNLTLIVENLALRKEFGTNDFIS